MKYIMIGLFVLLAIAFNDHFTTINSIENPIICNSESLLK
jgi:hypothetical protein